jgi:hypothetical protein
MEDNQVKSSLDKIDNILIDTETNKIIIEHSYTDPNITLTKNENNTQKIIYPSDISDLFFDIKEYLNNMGLNMLDKTPRHQQIGDFNQLIYNNIPNHKTDMIYNNNHNHKNTDNNGWQRV